MKKIATKSLVTLIVLAVIAVTAYESVAVVAPNERGVQVMLGEVTGDVLEPGMHFHPPFVSNIKKYSIVPKGMNVTFSVGKDGAITKDMQTVGSQVTVFYRYDGAKIMDAVKKYNESILENAITRSLVASVKESVGKYSIYELVENQDKITTDVTNALNAKLAEYPIEVTQLTISNWDWSEDFDKNIKETMNRTQQVRQAEQDLKLAETNAQKQVAEAEAQKKAAEQTAEGELIKAQKAAEAKRVEADALAYYNSKVAQNYQVEIKLKELEIELEKAKKWDGRQVPEYVPLTASGAIVNLPEAKNKQ
ncbi:MAG: prohibitin family protein [Treponema sp.]|uniref:prohibitin family protein n=1 Tax=Treponema sp. TaxID=166 RepID=UPI002A91CFB0|nr:prohibitin family protein [Treponema sp.]MDY6396441.1 prohibitin family protein [Treponema sp.]